MTRVGYCDSVASALGIMHIHVIKCPGSSLDYCMENLGLRPCRDLNHVCHDNRVVDLFSRVINLVLQAT